MYIGYTLDASQFLDNPANLPPITEIATMREPFVLVTIYTPQDYVGTLMDLCQDKRGVFKDMQYEGGRVKLTYDVPLNEVIFDFFDSLKSRSRGYASLDYELIGYQQSDLVKLDFLLNARGGVSFRTPRRSRTSYNPRWWL